MGPTLGAFRFNRTTHDKFGITKYGSGTYFYSQSKLTDQSQLFTGANHPQSEATVTLETFTSFIQSSSSAAVTA